MTEPLYTIGHGPRARDDLLDLLTAQGVSAVVDVRTLPRSKRHPHLSGDSMAKWFPEFGVSYTWDKRLGGWRDAPNDSPDTALRQTDMSGFAAHMRTSEFREAVAELLARLDTESVALLCAESLWWRCHRRLIADFTELVHGVPTWHLCHAGNLQRHRPMEIARLDADGTRLYYDAAQQRLANP